MTRFYYHLSTLHLSHYLGVYDLGEDLTSIDDFTIVLYLMRVCCQILNFIGRIILVEVAYRERDIDFHIQ